MVIFKHVLKRVAFVVLGYLLGVLVSFVAIVVLYAILSSLPDAPDYFSFLGLSPLWLLLAPPIALFVFYIALILTAAQALVAAAFSEFFELRNVFVHMVFGAAVAASGFFFASPTLADGISNSDFADLGILAAGGVAGGIAYWLVAGRDAGIRPQPSTTSPAM